MKHRTKKRVAAILVATLAAFATAAAAQGTQTPRDGGVYQFGANSANGAGNGQSQQRPHDRRQSGYPQPGTAADATGTAGSGGAMQDTDAAGPGAGSAQPGKRRMS